MKDLSKFKFIDNDFVALFKDIPIYRWTSPCFETIARKTEARIYAFLIVAVVMGLSIIIL